MDTDPNHLAPDVVVHAGKATGGAPGGRFRTDGPSSGEAFREDHLVPAFRRAQGGVVRVRLVEAMGWPPSWLEEAFGGLERHHHQLVDNVTLQVEGYEPDRREVEEYMTEARAARLGAVPQ